MFIVWSFLVIDSSDDTLNGRVSASVDVVSGVTQGCVLEPLLFILYTSELFHIVRNHIVGYADDTTI